jgi:hypothetical protein
MKKLIFLLFLSLPFQQACFEKETVCEIKRYCDLLIPQALYLYDQLGNPIYINGQRVQDVNEIYFNYRTGELFTHLFPPVYGVAVGDLLDIGTLLFNNWSDTNCEKGADAPESFTNPQLAYNGWGGQGTVPLNPHYAPPVFQNDPTGELTYTTFQLGLPGYYKVNFDSNFDKAIDEYSFGNNFYNGNSGGSQFGRSRVQQLAVAETANNMARSEWQFSGLPQKIISRSEYGIQYDRGTTRENYLDSPMARFLQSPHALGKFYEFKVSNPDKAFILP